MKTIPRNQARGFTLVELLVVITIIAIMAGTLLPQATSMIERARRTACANNLRQIGMVLKAYAQDNDGRYPFTGSANDSANKHFALLFPRWLKNEALFICRSAGHRGYRADEKIDGASSGEARTETLKAGENCYAYAWGLGGPATDEFPLASDQLAQTTTATQRWAKRGVGSNHGDDGGNVLYMDNRVEFVLAGRDGYWPANKTKLAACERGEPRDPANAEPSPEDR